MIKYFSSSNEDYKIIDYMIKLNMARLTMNLGWWNNKKQISKKELKMLFSHYPEFEACNILLSKPKIHNICIILVIPTNTTDMVRLKLLGHSRIDELISNMEKLNLLTSEKSHCSFSVEGTNIVASKMFNSMQTLK